MNFGHLFLKKRNLLCDLRELLTDVIVVCLFLKARNLLCDLRKLLTDVVVECP